MDARVKPGHDNSGFPDAPFGSQRSAAHPGKRCFGASLQDDGALAPGNVASGREGRLRLILVVAVERQQALAAQTIDLRQIEADTGLVDPGDGAIEMSEASPGRPAASSTSAARPR